MKKQLLSILMLVLAMVFTADTIYAQASINANTYRYNMASGSVTGITPTVLIPAASDQVASAVTNIGFTFWFAGTAYTQFSVNENGLMTLGSTQVSGSASSNLMGSGSPNPKIAPYWDDLATGTTGSVGYQVTGAAPNRILYITWNVTIPKNAAAAPNATFQVKLYEATGNIFFAYGAGMVANSGQYSIGIGNSATDFASLQVTGSTAATCNYGTATDNNTLAISSGRQVQFSTDNTAPSISAVTLPVTVGAISTLTATIGDQAGSVVSGIPVPPSANVPRVYFKKITDVSWVSAAGALTSGNGNTGSWTFTIDHSLIGAASGDVINYFLIAQDQADYKGFPNITSSPTGAVAANVNSITTPPAAPLYFILPGTFSGIKTVGVGGDFTSLTLAGGLFDQINAGSLTGNLTIDIISDLTSETGFKGLNAWVNGPGGPFTITINPVGNRIISGITVNGGNTSVITLNGVTGLTIDGLNDGINTLEFVQTGQYYIGSVIDLKGASNNTITRITVKGYGASNNGISITTGAIAASNNIISYCNLTSSVLPPSTAMAGNGISFINASTGTILTGNNNIVDHNILTNFAYNGITTYSQSFTSGKFSNTTISNNEIYNTVGTAANNNFRGIYIANAVVGTTNVFNNKIHDLFVQFTSVSTGIPGILTAAPTGTTTNIYNNVIYLDASPVQANLTWSGIQTTGAGAANIYYNSIYIGGTNVTAGSSYGIKKDGTGSTDILNNAVFNSRSNSAGTGKHYGIYTTGTFTSNHNDIFVNGTGGVFGNNGVDRLTLADWITSTSQDSFSYSGDPGFTSTTNLLPDSNNVNSLNLNDHGIPIASISTDIIGNLRSTSLPNLTDIGAYEFTPNTVAYLISGNAGISGAVLSYTDGSPKTVTADINGLYSFRVPDHWTGVVTLAKTGYTFDPANRTYTDVISDQLSQDYIAAPIFYIISGNAGLAGATLSWTDGIPKTVITDSIGNYSFTVSYNWSGAVTPSFTGYTFTPANKTYTNVLTDKLNQDYTAAPTVFIISGNAGMSGTVLSWTDTTAHFITVDTLGGYSIIVSYNWSGTITPSKSGYGFSPSNRTYTNVLSDQINQNYVAAPNIIYAKLKVFIEGSFIINTDSMRTNLNSAHLIPLSSQAAYDTAAFGYLAKTVSSIPNNSIVDWVLVELRSGTGAETRITTQAAFLKNNGEVVDTDGVSLVPFHFLVPGNYYIVIRHRNHLAIMSSVQVALSEASTLYDFTIAQTQAFGTDAMSALDGANTIFGMVAGNDDGNIFITISDYDAVYFNLFKLQYLEADLDLNGVVTTLDYYMIAPNLFKFSQVPEITPLVFPKGFGKSIKISKNVQ